MISVISYQKSHDVLTWTMSPGKNVHSSSGIRATRGLRNLKCLLSSLEYFAIFLCIIKSYCIWVLEILSANKSGSIFSRYGVLEIPGVSLKNVRNWVQITFQAIFWENNCKIQIFLSCIYFATNWDKFFVLKHSFSMIFLKISRGGVRNLPGGAPFCGAWFFPGYMIHVRHIQYIPKRIPDYRKFRAYSFISNEK